MVARVLYRAMSRVHVIAWAPVDGFCRGPGMFKAQGCRVLEASVAGATTRGRSDAASRARSRGLSRVWYRACMSMRGCPCTACAEDLTSHTPHTPVYGSRRRLTHFRLRTAHAEGFTVVPRARVAGPAGRWCTKFFTCHYSPARIDGSSALVESMGQAHSRRTHGRLGQRIREGEPRRPLSSVSHTVSYTTESSNDSKHGLTINLDYTRSTSFCGLNASDTFACSELQNLAHRRERAAVRRRRWPSSS